MLTNCIVLMKSFQIALEADGFESSPEIPLMVLIPAHAKCLLNRIQGELQDGGHDVDDAEAMVAISPITMPIPAQCACAMLTN